MYPLSPVMQDHVTRLNQEILDLERDKRRLMEGLRAANEDCRQHKVYYAYILKKQENLVKHNRTQREELYNAVMSGDATRVGKIEVKITTSNNKAHELQLEIPTRLKQLTQAIKREQEYEEAIRSIRHKMVLRTEEIHNYRPCQSFLCDHCRGKSETRPRKREKRRYREDIEGQHEEDKQFQRMMQRIVSKVRNLSL